MHIDYEISERDYLNAQRLAIKNHPNRWARWTQGGLPVFGLLLLLGYLLNLSIIVPKHAFSLGYLFAILIPGFFISTPFLNKRNQRKLYAKSTVLHGKLGINADEEGIELRGPSFQSKVDWSIFDFFCEDNDSFVLFQRTLAINIIPKRELSGCTRSFGRRFANHDLLAKNHLY